MWRSVSGNLVVTEEPAKATWEMAWLVQMISQQPMSGVSLPLVSLIYDSLGGLDVMFLVKRGLA